MRRSAFDIRHPMFAPLWRRIALTAIVVVWTGVELIAGSVLWALLFGAIAAYLAYEFFFVFDPEDYVRRDE